MEFSTPNGTISVIVGPKMMALYDDEGRVLASRLQVPLVLAYALTVHRVQGLDLPKIVYDMSSVFAVGQVYSAFSRVPAWTKVDLIGTVKEGVKLQHPDVLEFMEQQRFIDIWTVKEEVVELEDESDDSGYDEVWFDL